MLSYRTALKRLLDSDSKPKLGLERMLVLMASLGHPYKAYPIFHVGGTNGKGSTCAFLESILRTAGFKTGLYTSPHLMCARERIQINRSLISEEHFADLESRVLIEASFFERITAMAFLYFAEQQVDLAIVEVGLGGRLDATNVVRPLVAGISRIDLDHQAILGNSLTQIANEKVGIFKTGVAACWSSQEPEIEAVLSHSARRISSQDSVPNKLGLYGPHQRLNAALAMDMIQASGLRISEGAIQVGLENTQWPCRYEWIKSGKILLDGAHNPAGIQALMNTVLEDPDWKDKPMTLWVGMTEGHGGQEMAYLLAQAFPLACVYVGQSKSPRALPVAQVSAYFRKADLRVYGGEPSLEDPVLVTGSLYWAGEIRARYISMPADCLKSYY